MTTTFTRNRTLRLLALLLTTLFASGAIGDPDVGYGGLFIVWALATVLWATCSSPCGATVDRVIAIPAAGTCSDLDAPQRHSGQSDTPARVYSAALRAVSSIATDRRATAPSSKENA